MARQLRDGAGEEREPARRHKNRPRSHKPGPKAHKRPSQADTPPALTDPPCAECGLQASLVGGQVIYPHRPDLHGRWFWRCPRCEPASYCGCHKGGDGRQSLGRPAGPYLRKARGKVHELIDALWTRAEAMPCYHPFSGNAWQVRSKARQRVYAYMRVKLKLKAHEAHTGWMDLAQCREAWKLLAYVKGMHIRDWWNAGGEDEFLAIQAEDGK